MLFQAAEEDSSGLGLLDETPAPIVLNMGIEDGVLTFSQTEHTKEYLAVT